MGFISAPVDLSSPAAIGSTTPNTGAFTTLSANNGTLTASSPAFTLEQTWNSAGITFTALRANITDTASASASLLMDLRVGGSSKAVINKSGGIQANVGQASLGFGFTFLGGTNGIYSPSASGSWFLAYAGTAVAEVRSSGIGLQTGSLSWGGTFGGTQDVILTRDAAAILAQRNGINAQTFRLYNTYTDASNYERGFFRWSSNVLELGTEAAGTGTARTVRFYGQVAMGVTNQISGAHLQIGSVPYGSAADSSLFVSNSLSPNNPVIINAHGVSTTTRRASILFSNSYGSAYNKAFEIGTDQQKNGTHDFYWYDNLNNVARMYIDANGKVGIATTSPSVLLDVNSNTIRLRTARTPASASAAGDQGSICWDDSYIYVCTATNTWKRVAISTWP